MSPTWLGYIHYFGRDNNAPWDDLIYSARAKPPHSPARQEKWASPFLLDYDGESALTGGVEGLVGGWYCNWEANNYRVHDWWMYDENNREIWSDETFLDENYDIPNYHTVELDSMASITVSAQDTLTAIIRPNHPDIIQFTPIIFDPGSRIQVENGGQFHMNFDGAEIPEVELNGGHLNFIDPNPGWRPEWWETVSYLPGWPYISCDSATVTIHNLEMQDGATLTIGENKTLIIEEGGSISATNSTIDVKGNLILNGASFVTTNTMINLEGDLILNGNSFFNNTDITVLHGEIVINHPASFSSTNGAQLALLGSNLTINSPTTFASDIEVRHGQITVSTGIGLTLLTGVNLTIGNALDVSSFIVSEDASVYVAPGAFINIFETSIFNVEKGSTFHFGTNSGIYLQSPQQLTVNGTADQPVQFKLMTDSDFWQGIHIYTNSSPMDQHEYAYSIKHAIIEGASNGLKINRHGSPGMPNLRSFSIYNTTFNDNGVGIHFDTTTYDSVFVDSCTFDGNTTGFFMMSTTPVLSFENNTFTENTLGCRFYSVSAGTLHNSSFDGNENGILVEYSDINLTDCTFSNNTGYGLNFNDAVTNISGGAIRDNVTGLQSVASTLSITCNDIGRNEPQGLSLDNSTLALNGVDNTGGHNTIYRTAIDLQNNSHVVADQNCWLTQDNEQNYWVILDSEDVSPIFSVDETSNISIGNVHVVSPECSTPDIPIMNYPPVMNLNGPYTGIVGLPVSFTSDGSYDPDGTIVSYSWDFGENESSQQPNPTQVYWASGTYPVILTVHDNYGNIETETTSVTINPPEPLSIEVALPYHWGWDTSNQSNNAWRSFSTEYGRVLYLPGEPYDGVGSIGMGSQFSGTYATNFNLLYLNLSNEYGAALSFWWKHFNEDYNEQEGVYFSDDGGNTYTKVMDLDGSTIPENTWTNFQLDIDELASNNDLELSENFIIGFLQYGNEVLCAGGYAIDCVDIFIENNAPVAEANGPYTSSMNESIAFSSEGSLDSDGDIVSYLWDFGNGDTSAESNPDYSYWTAGEYTVTLTITDDDGAVHTDNASVIVSPPQAVYATLPYSNDFQAGSLDNHWITTSSTNGVITVPNYLKMDSENGTATTEVWLNLNFAAPGQVDMSFRWKHYFDQYEEPDGVFFSDDGGLHFTKVLDLNSSTYHQGLYPSLRADAPANGHNPFKFPQNSIDTPTAMNGYNFVERTWRPSHAMGIESNP